MNIPSIFIFESLNKDKLPPKMLVVFLKNLFRYGRKEVKIVGNRVHLHLSYSPRNETVEAKIGQLPVKYLRVAADDEEELQLFLRGIKEFSNINFYVESERKRPIICSEEAQDGEGRDEREKQRKKIKILENRLIQPSTSSVAAANSDNINPIIEIFTEDIDEFEGQKYTYL